MEKRPRMQDGTGYIPMAIRAPGLKMSASSVKIDMDVPTIFIGVINKNYTEDMWETDAGKMCKLFSCAFNVACLMKIPSVSEDELDIDSNSLDQTMERALQFINSKQVNCVRIVRIGSGASISINEALQSLIEGWNPPPPKKPEILQKTVIFVTCGDSKYCSTLQFCKTLCLLGKCNTLEYYDTLDYNSYGYLDYRRQVEREIFEAHHCEGESHSE